MNQQLLQQLCDEYSVGLLEGDELERLTKSVDAGDPAVLDQLRESADLLAELAWLAPPSQPPPLLRSQVLNRVRLEERRQQPATVPPAKLGPARSRPWGWAVAAALAVTSLYSYMAMRAAHGDLERLREQLTSVRTEAARSRKVLAVVLSRDAKYIRLSTSPNEPVFRAFWGAAAGLVLTGADVPSLKQGRTFQLWVVPKAGGNPVSAGVFAPQPDGQVLLIAETRLGPGDAAALAISDEPEGGSPQPTTKPVFVGPVGD